MPKSFTEKERASIYAALQDACKRNWIEHGYKKTSVDELCKSVGISKGAFYLFYSTKEALFCDVIVSEQNKICDIAEEEMQADDTLSGVTNALKKIYRIYDENAFLYQSDARDYELFQDKLSEKQKRQLSMAQDRSRQIFLKHKSLAAKKDDEMICSVIYSLIMLNKEKDLMAANHFQVFDLLVESVIPELFERKDRT